MSEDTARKLKDKIVALADQLSRLERKRDDMFQKGRVREAVVVFGDVTHTQRRLDAAKRFLARKEGDEYDFVAR